MQDLLEPVTIADAGQLRLEQWTRRLQGFTFTKILIFARTTASIRAHEQSVTTLNALIAAAAEIRRTGQDLTAGTVKTMDDAREALVSLIAARDVQVREFHDHVSAEIESQSLDVKKKKVAECATGSFGQVAGAPPGAARSCSPPTSLCPVGAQQMPVEDLQPLAQTKGLSMDASEVLALVTKWHAEKVPDGTSQMTACCDIECDRCILRTKQTTSELNLTLTNLQMTTSRLAPPTPELRNKRQ